MEFVYNNIAENVAEKVLILCHPKRYFTDILFKVISMKILRKENIKDIKLEFMSQPETYRLNDTKFMESYKVNYYTYFDENLDINKIKGKYSLIIMNTCPFVYSPNLNNKIVVNKLTEVLKPSGYIVFTEVTEKKIYYNDVEKYKNIKIELFERFTTKFFYNKFNIIDIPIKTDETVTKQNNKLYDLNKAPLLKYKVYLLFQLKDSNIKENNEKSNNAMSSSAKGFFQLKDSNIKKNNKKSNNAMSSSAKGFFQLKDSNIKENNEKNNNTISNIAKGGKKSKTRKKYNHKTNSI
jgi:hypothetical protein